MMVNKLLIDDYPIQVLPKLAEKVGLNEAIFLQQLHYWLNGKSAKTKDNRKWIYNTYEDWKKQFPFWSTATIKRTIGSLSKQNLIIKGNYNKAGFDKTVWYSIDYEELERVSRRLGQNDPTRGSNCTNGEGQNDPTNTIDYTETTTETTKTIMSSKPDLIPYSEIIKYLNHTTGKNYKVTQKWKDLIKARWNEGQRLDDFKKVIDVKSSQWLNSKDMNKYLRPQTLFGNKFDEYLNEYVPKVESSRISDIERTQRELREVYEQQ